MKNESIAQMRSSIEIIEEQNAELKDKVKILTLLQLKNNKLIIYFSLLKLNQKEDSIQQIADELERVNGLFQTKSKEVLLISVFFF